MTRREKLLFGLDLGRMRGVEIGALHAPLVGKHTSEIYYVDHADQAGLREKYRDDPNVDIDAIVPVDAVWGEGRLRDRLPGPFDYVIASHVIEHVPDLIGWLQEVGEILRPGGRLCLAILDKQFTFDYLRQPTRLCDAIDAYLRGHRRPMPAQVFDFNQYAAEVDCAAAWLGPLDPRSLKRFVDLRYAWDRCLEAMHEGKYLDGHCWVFTPDSLLLLCAELVEFDLLPYRCAAFHPTERGELEMMLVLERGADDAADRTARAAGFRDALGLPAEAPPDPLATLQAELWSAREDAATAPGVSCSYCSRCAG